MATRKRTERTPASEPPAAIVDVVFEDGLLFLSVENLDSQPLLKVTAKFDQPIVDASGRDVTKLALFRRIEFLAPRRVIRTFVDSSTGYFARKQPARFAVELSWRDMSGARHGARIAHDVGIYRDLAFVTQRP